MTGMESLEVAGKKWTIPKRTRKRSQKNHPKGGPIANKGHLPDEGKEKPKNQRSHQPQKRGENGGATNAIKGGGMGGGKR